MSSTRKIVGADGVPFSNSCGILHAIMSEKPDSKTVTVMRAPPRKISRNEFDQLVQDKLVLSFETPHTCDQNSPLIAYISNIDSEPFFRLGFPVFPLPMVVEAFFYSRRRLRIRHENTLLWSTTRDDAKDVFRIFCDGLLMSITHSLSEQQRSDERDSSLVFAANFAYSASSVVNEPDQRERVFATLLALAKLKIGTATIESIEFDLNLDKFANDRLARIHEKALALTNRRKSAA